MTTRPTATPNPYLLSLYSRAALRLVNTMPSITMCIEPPRLRLTAAFEESDLILVELSSTELKELARLMKAYRGYADQGSHMGRSQRPVPPISTFTSLAKLDYLIQDFLQDKLISKGFTKNERRNLTVLIVSYFMPICQ